MFVFLSIKLRATTDNFLKKLKDIIGIRVGQNSITEYMEHGHAINVINSNSIIYMKK